MDDMGDLAEVLFVLHSVLLIISYNWPHYRPTLAPLSPYLCVWPPHAPPSDAFVTPDSGVAAGLNCTLYDNGHFYLTLMAKLTLRYSMNDLKVCPDCLDFDGGHAH